MQSANQACSLLHSVVKGGPKELFWINGRPMMRSTVPPLNGALNFTVALHFSLEPWSVGASKAVPAPDPVAPRGHDAGLGGVPGHHPSDTTFSFCTTRHSRGKNLATEPVGPSGRTPMTTTTVAVPAESTVEASKSPRPPKVAVRTIRLSRSANAW